MKIWILSTCIPEDCRPCAPEVFTDEDDAMRRFEHLMRAEWASNAPSDEDGAPFAFPDGDPEEAHNVMADANEGWGQWELTWHEIPASAVPAEENVGAARQETVS